MISLILNITHLQYVIFKCAEALPWYQFSSKSFLQTGFSIPNNGAHCSLASWIQVFPGRNKQMSSILDKLLDLQIVFISLICQY